MCSSAYRRLSWRAPCSGDNRFQRPVAIADEGLHGMAVRSRVERNSVGRAVSPVHCMTSLGILPQHEDVQQFPVRLS